uniref:D-aminoacyl-tRNA deacylase n=1 Tax=Cuerna arida TaxID=1464854 RepID=A0A1B6FX88_9HEMI
MRAVIQRVTSASVTVDGEIISSIGKGLCILIGISRDDTQKDIDYLVKKILNLRLFGNDDRKWTASVVDQAGEVLCLSQITLYHSLKGNRLDFHHAMAPQQSQQFYQQFLTTLRQQYIPEKVKEGKFGAELVVNINNDGPVTICLESPLPQKPVKTETSV